MKEVKILGLIIILFVIIFLSGCVTQSNNKQPTPSSQITTTTEPQAGKKTSLDSDHDGIPDDAEKLLGTDPLNNDTDGDGVDDLHDSTPTFVDIPPKLSTGSQGFKIQQILVENNYDEQAKKTAPDHLELTLQSTTSKDISNMVVYYIITDAKINKTESYLKPLNGFVLKANEIRTIHFDTEQKPDHFRANPNSIYYTSMDELNFTVTINADGYAAQTIHVDKAAGGAETPD